MPEFTRIALERGSVANCLALMKRDLLPEELARDSLVRWVMSFDALEKESDQRHYRNDQRYRDDNQNWESQLSADIVIDILQTQIPFYFGSLFYIGRMWQNAVFSMENIDDVKRTENLLASAQNLKALNEQNNLDVSIESFIVLITEMCELSREQQFRQLNLARELWEEWKSEVELYRRRTNEFEKAFEKYGWRYEGRRRWDREEGDDLNRIIRPTMQLLVLAMRGSSLKRKLQGQGVQFKSEIAVQPLAFQSISAFLTVLTLLNTHEGDQLVHVVRDFVEEQRELSKEQRLTPEVAAALEILKRKYEELNPFVKYGAGKLAPTLELLELIREHGLPNGKDSPWLSNWKRSLDDAPSRYDKLPKPRGQSGQARNLSVQLADSTIKRNLTQKLNPTESWEDFLQRIFEREWIEVLAVMAGKTNQEVKSLAQQWDLQAFQIFITNTVVGLNNLGYSLTVPDSTRLALLFEKVAKSKNYYEKFEW